MKRKSEEPSFAEATVRFAEFLAGRGHRGPLVWVRPSDVVLWRGRLLIHPVAASERETERTFAEGVRRAGAVLEAFARSGSRTCCFVHAPATADDAARQFIARPFAMKVRSNLPEAWRPPTVLWQLMRGLARPGSWTFGYDSVE